MLRWRKLPVFSGPGGILWPPFERRWGAAGASKGNPADQQSTRTLHLDVHLSWVTAETACILVTSPECNRGTGYQCALRQGCCSDSVVKTVQDIHTNRQEEQYLKSKHWHMWQHISCLYKAARGLSKDEQTLTVFVQ